MKNQRIYARHHAADTFGLMCGVSLMPGLTGSCRVRIANRCAPLVCQLNRTESHSVAHRHCR
jgi:hypothetical protein